MTIYSQVGKGWTITTCFLTDELLANCDNSVDRRASIDAYWGMLERHLAQVFPHAIIGVHHQSNDDSLSWPCKTRVHSPRQIESCENAITQCVDEMAKRLAISEKWVVPLRPDS